MYHVKTLTTLEAFKGIVQLSGFVNTPNRPLILLVTRPRLRVPPYRSH
jgi:hypothetical protein